MDLWVEKRNVQSGSGPVGRPEHILLLSCLLHLRKYRVSTENDGGQGEAKPPMNLHWLHLFSTDTEDVHNNQPKSLRKGVSQAKVY